MVKRECAIARLATMLLGLALTWNCVSTAHAQDDDEKLEQLLERMGLVDLQILHLERSLERSRPAPRQDESARRLADLYAGRLMASSDDKARYQDTERRIDALITKHPNANTAALQVMLLQADYNRAEAQIAAWIADPKNTAARDEASRILSLITPQLDKHQKELNTQVDQLIAKIDRLEDGDELRMLEQQLRRVQGVTARATYFAAWANYYLPTVSQGGAKDAAYGRARAIFRKVLGLGDEPMQKVEPEWLGLESIWRSRALVGLGLSEAACGDIAACDKCFQLLDNAAVPAQVQEQAPYWYVRALLNAGQQKRVIAYAAERISRFRPPATQGQVSLCVALVRAGYSGPAAGRTSQQRELGQLGLIGLARLRQMKAIRELVDQYDVPPAEATGFVLLWARGQQQFNQAESSKSAADYAQAAGMLLDALKSPEADSLAPLAAQCRYVLAWCYYRQEEYEEAAREFTTAIAGLKAAGNSLAAESAWMAFAAYRRLSQDQPRYLSAASDALKKLQREFPDHDHAKRADYELARLLASRSPDEMIRRLESIPPSNPNYASAQYDLCLLWHQRWSKQRSAGEESLGTLTRLRQAAESFLGASGPDVTNPRKVKCCVLVADALLNGAQGDVKTAEKFLGRAAALVDDLSSGDSAVAEYHYRWLQLATARDDQDLRRQHARWLAENASGTPYETAGIVIMANSVDRQVRAAEGKGEKGPVDEAYRVYRQLVAHLGSSPDVLAANKNARIAASKLADYALRQGDPALAAEHLENLLVVFPRDRQYLRRAGLAHWQAGETRKAASHWRTLLAGLPKDSDSWFEAKYYQLLCLEKTDKSRAGKVFRQFKLLHPNLGPAAWRDKFQKLGEKLPRP